ncbi:hypothetical protein OS493_037425 [Desmophyllum pertusum]|uniref:Helicase Helix-turn-helix domain-containing protein n=1 Tax=Desmophyllum pertusum TaxID=174260 RepID=A0A9W9YUL6_9CNID|nr:hypothetical protein OS493_037425 [Desmophyllum pertusum]
MDQRKRTSQSSHDGEASGSKRMKPESNKIHLRQLYGKNQPSDKKIRIAEELRTGKDFTQLSSELGIAKATAEVYGIDCLAAGKELDHKRKARYLGITSEDFQVMTVNILSNEDNKLRTIRDALNEEFSYNQIRFVLACLIQELEF